MSKIFVSLLGGLIGLGLLLMLFRSELFDEGTRNPEKISRMISEQHRAFEAMTHLPWDADALITSVRSNTSQLTITLNASPPPASMVKSTVCSYRKLRELVLSDVLVRLVWEPEARGSVVEITKIETCLTLR